MSILLIPVAPLSRTKSRLRDCFSVEQLIDLTIAMFKDLGNTLSKVKCFKNKIVYCNNSEILDLATDYKLIGIKEELTTPHKSFAKVIQDLNGIAISEFKAKATIFTFLDLILISPENFYEIYSLLSKNNITVCPAMNSGGISIFGRKPPNIISSNCFSDLKKTSLISLYDEAKEKRLEITFYDSFKAGFDVDVKQDLVFAYNYLKLFNLTHTETFKFLNDNLNLTLQKNSSENNRDFKIVPKILR